MPIASRWMDYQGRTVEWTADHWAHILEGHGEMADRLGEIARTVEVPTLVVRDPDIQRVEHHYGAADGELRIHVVVIYRPTPDAWVDTIRTAHLTDRLKKGEHLRP